MIDWKKQSPNQRQIDLHVPLNPDTLHSINR